MKKYLLLVLAVALLPGFTACQAQKKGLKKNIPTNTNTNTAFPTIPGVTTGSGSVSNSEIVAGLKQALEVGTNNGTAQVSQTDGFFKNAAIKILMPPDVKMVESKLREYGMGEHVDKAILQMNRAAEQAAKEAAPIFIDAIKGMSITDAVGILRGSNDAATVYLKNNTSAQLTDKFRPIIKKALDQTQATKYWNDVFVNYNKLPFVTPVNANLDDYVTQKALEGLFHTIAQEELKIRQDPAARITDLLKKVFG
ncbi:MAG TPA: DUF4197 domain-containing protein [Chitinophagales bacterium]|nr:DUF4197 domain-containing protein [Chitinophagales bacterium]